MRYLSISIIHIIISTAAVDKSANHWVCDDNDDGGKPSKSKQWWSTETGNQGPGASDGSTGKVDVANRGKQSEGETQDSLIQETVVGKAEGSALGPAWEALGQQQSHLIKRMTFPAVWRRKLSPVHWGAFDLWKILNGTFCKDYWFDPSAALNLKLPLGNVDQNHMHIYIYI